MKIEPHENGPLFVEWHYYLAAGRWYKYMLHMPIAHGAHCNVSWRNYVFLMERNMLHLTIVFVRPEHLKAWKEPAHLPALWGYGSHSFGDEKLRSQN